MPAKPRRKQAKPLVDSKDPNMYVAAQVNRETGVIHRTIRGRNFIVDANEWEDVTDDPRILELLSTHGPSKLLRKNGKLVTKPRIKIDADAFEFEAVDGKVNLHFKVDGSTKHLPETIKVRINSKLVEIEPNGTIELKSKVPNRLTVKVEDDRVHVAEKPISIMSVPKGELGRPKARLKQVDDDTVVVGKRG